MWVLVPKSPQGRRGRDVEFWELRKIAQMRIFDLTNAKVCGIIKIGVCEALAERGE